MASNNEHEFSFDYAGALKCSFAEPKGRLKGAFCSIIYKGEARVIETIFWTTKVKSPIDVPVSLEWEQFSTKIPEIGQLDKENNEKLQAIISQKLTQTEIENLFSADNDISPFRESLQLAFEDFLHYGLALEMEFEPFTKERLKAAGYERDTAAAETTENVSMTDIMLEGIDETKSITCLPKIDPVNGIAASALQYGDMLEVTVATNTSAGKLIADYYSKRGEEPLFPVEDIKISDSGSVIVVMSVGGGMTGVVKCSGDIKLKGKKTSAVSESFFGAGQRSLFIGGIAALLVIAALVFVIVRIIE